MLTTSKWLNPTSRPHLGRRSTSRCEPPATVPAFRDGDRAGIMVALKGSPSEGDERRGSWHSASSRRRLLAAVCGRGYYTRGLLLNVVQFIIVVALFCYAGEVQEMKKNVTSSYLHLSTQEHEENNSNQGLSRTDLSHSPALAAAIAPITGQTAAPITKKQENSNQGLLRTDLSQSSASAPAVAISTTQQTAAASKKQQNQMKCRWRLDGKECLQLLRSRIPPPYHNRRWAFFGDSTMQRLWAKGGLDKSLNKAGKHCNCKTRRSDRCNRYSTYGFSKATNWTPPKYAAEGPRRYGLENPQCMDCGGCFADLAECATFPCDHSTASYFGVEYARDVEIQTTVTNTTQEAVSLYMKRQQSQKYPFTCVVSTGLHDMAIKGMVFQKTFVENIEWHFRILQSNCANLIWLSGTSVLSQEEQYAKYAQNSPLMLRITGMVESVLRNNADFRDWATIVDPFELSQNWTHHDNVHMDDAWYETLAGLFVKFSQSQ